jgi:hypothetical protein
MKYNDSVIYVKNGVPIQGIVLTVNGDLLSILYADPESESLAFQGNLARIAQVARSVKPMVDGAMFGWESITPPTMSDVDWRQLIKAGDDRADELEAHIKAATTEPRIVIFGEGLIVSTPGKSNNFPAVILEPASPAGTVGADASANASQDAILPGAVVLEFHGPAGASVLVQDISGLFPTPAEKIDPETSTPNPSEADPTTEVGEPQTTTSEPTQASSETHSEN